MDIFTTNNYEDEICITLKSVMDLTMAEDLRLGLLDCLAENKTIKIMAGDVDRITTPCLQVLLAMKHKSIQQDIDLLYPVKSEVFNSAVKAIGLENQFTALEQK